jgi:hypothetical protein
VERAARSPHRADRDRTRRSRLSQRTPRQHAFGRRADEGSGAADQPARRHRGKRAQRLGIRAQPIAIRLAGPAVADMTAHHRTSTPMQTASTLERWRS